MPELPTVKISYIITIPARETTKELWRIEAFYGEVTQQDSHSCFESVIFNRYTKEIIEREKFSQTQYTISVNDIRYTVPVSKYLLQQSLLTKEVIESLTALSEQELKNHPSTKQILYYQRMDNSIHHSKSVTNSLSIERFVRNRNSAQQIIKTHPNLSGIAVGYLKKITKSSELQRIKANSILAIPQHLLPRLMRHKFSGLIVVNDHPTQHRAQKPLHIPHLTVKSSALQDITDGTFISLNAPKGEITIIGKVKNSLLSKRVESKKIEFFPESENSVNAKSDGYSFLNAMALMRAILKNHKKGTYTEALVHYFVNELKIAPEKPVIYQSVCVASGTSGLLGKHGGQYIRENPDFFIEELNALHQLLNIYNFKNITLTLPFIRTVKELEDIKKIITHHKLTRSPRFKLFITLQVPSTILQLEEYLDLGIDGIILDVQCLTDLTMGIDSHLFKKNYATAQHTYQFLDETYAALKTGGLCKFDESLVKDHVLDRSITRIIEHCAQITKLRHTPLYIYFADNYEDEKEMELNHTTQGSQKRTSAHIHHIQ